MASLSGNRVVLVALAVGYPLVAVGLFLKGYSVNWSAAIYVPLVIYLYRPKKQPPEPTVQELDQWSGEDKAQFKRLLDRQRK